MTDTLIGVSPPPEPAEAGDAEDRELSPAELAALRTWLDPHPLGTSDPPPDPGRFNQPNTIGALAIAVARAMDVGVAYLPGLAMRRIADLHPGTAKTDARDAYVIADAAHAGADDVGR